MLTPKPDRAPEDLRTVLGVCAGLAVVTWLVFGQTCGYGFVNFDDDRYVYENPMVAGGLTAKGILWAFTHFHAQNWHPLTSITHMLDCRLYGLNAGGHHATNVLLHAATAMALFLVLRRMTGVLWRSAFVAAVFAVHPLRVESVAWVAERKDVLSGLFFMLTLWAYARYAQNRSRTECPAQPFDARSRAVDYFLVVFFFALGLLSKPMLVTLPFVLLLLDYWPLRRFQQSASSPGPIRWSLIVEKIPLFVLSAASCAITLAAQRDIAHSAEAIRIPLRISNALVSCVIYLRELVYPGGLAAFYPYPASGVPALDIAFAVLLLAGISAAAWFWGRRRPYLIVGWLWYLGMLVPVLGLIQVGGQARADRYTYLSQIGLTWLLTWGVAEMAAASRHRRWLPGAGAVVILATLIACARNQTRYWRDSESLWLHTLACTSGNAIAEGNLGNAFLHQGQMDEAVVHCQNALAIRPDYADAQNCLGFALLQKGQVDEAISNFQDALGIDPSSASIHNNFGMALLRRGSVDEAVAHFQKAIETGPELAEFHSNLGVALLREGQVEAAVTHYRKALDLKPDYPAACNNLAWVLATSPRASVRDGAGAVALAQRADRLSGGSNVLIVRTLAAAYAEAGLFPEALETIRRALDLAASQGDTAMVNALREEGAHYQAGSPLRDTGSKP